MSTGVAVGGSAVGVVSGVGVIVGNGVGVLAGALGATVAYVVGWAVTAGEGDAQAAAAISIARPPTNKLLALMAAGNAFSF